MVRTVPGVIFSQRPASGSAQTRRVKSTVPLPHGEIRSGKASPCSSGSRTTGPCPARSWTHHTLTPAARPSPQTRPGTRGPPWRATHGCGAARSPAAARRPPPADRWPDAQPAGARRAARPHGRRPRLAAPRSAPATAMPPRPASHVVTACRETCSRSASAAWESPLRVRSSLMRWVSAMALSFPGGDGHSLHRVVHPGVCGGTEGGATCRRTPATPRCPRSDMGVYGVGRGRQLRLARGSRRRASRRGRRRPSRG